MVNENISLQSGETCVVETQVGTVTLLLSLLTSIPESNVNPLLISLIVILSLRSKVVVNVPPSVSPPVQNSPAEQPLPFGPINVLPVVVN